MRLLIRSFLLNSDFGFVLPQLQHVICLFSLPFSSRHTLHCADDDDDALDDDDDMELDEDEDEDDDDDEDEDEDEDDALDDDDDDDGEDI